MFFYIGQECPIKSVEKVAENLFLDKGWKCDNINGLNYWYKGYSTDCVLSSNIKEIINGYKANGKYVIVSEMGDIHHPLLRGFPLYTNQKGILSNIPLTELNMVNYSQPFITRKSNISLEEASIQINEVLKENVVNFFRYNKIDKLNVLFSGGIDTLTVWSLVDSLGHDYDFHLPVPSSFKSLGRNQEYQSDLMDLCSKKFWSYNLTSCYTKENWYITGFYSERIQLREVTQGHAIANYVGKNLHEIPTIKDYLYYFLQRPDKKINYAPTLTNEQDLLDYCNGTIYYDYQMWHIDNNYHFSPFYDIRITDIVNQLSLEDIVSNALNVIIQKNIIKYNRPDFLQLLADYKNAGNVYANYEKNFSKIILRENITKYIP